MKNPVIPALGNRKLADLQQMDLQRFINALAAPKEKAGKALSPKTVKNIHGTLHKALSSDQIAKFLQAIQDEKYERIFRLALMTGMGEREHGI